jgi:hypothetical protein
MFLPNTDIYLHVYTDNLEHRHQNYNPENILSLCTVYDKAILYQINNDANRISDTVLKSLDGRINSLNLSRNCMSQVS